MTEAGWRSTDDWRAMLAWLVERPVSTRKWTLYMCGGLRQIWDRWLYADYSRNAVEVAERAADGLATEKEIHDADYLAEVPTFGLDFESEFVLRQDPGRRFSADFCRLLGWGMIREDEIGLGEIPEQRANRSRGRRIEIGDDDQQEIERLLSRTWLGTPDTRTQLMRAARIAEYSLNGHYTQSDTIEPSDYLRERITGQSNWPASWLLRELFGNPFAPVRVEPAWRMEAAVGLALGIYEDRAFERMPILADALEEAGCDDADILSHCREPGIHVRGCWVVDLVLGKA